MKALKNRRGQSAIEFIVCVVVIFFFLLFFLSIAILLVTSDYLEYSAFMAARTLKSGYSDEQVAKNNAQTVFRAYAQKVDGVVRSFRDLRFPTIDGTNETMGVEANYSIDMFYLPPVFVSGGKAPISRITLSAEAHLGRDPGIEDCVSVFRRHLQTMGLDVSLAEEMDDNGC